MDLKQLREQTVAKITEDLDELSIEQLNELRALESLEDPPRSSLIKAIDGKLAEIKAANPNTEESGAAPAPVSAAEAPVASAPAWQAVDYVGPLTGEQALWRQAHEADFEKQVITK